MSSNDSNSDDDFFEDSDVDDQNADGYRVSQWNDDDEQMGYGMQSRGSVS